MIIISKLLKRQNKLKYIHQSSSTILIAIILQFWSSFGNWLETFAVSTQKEHNFLANSQKNLNEDEQKQPIDSFCFLFTLHQLSFWISSGDIFKLIFSLYFPTIFTIFTIHFLIIVQKAKSDSRILLLQVFREK